MDMLYVGTIQFQDEIPTFQVLEAYYVLCKVDKIFFFLLMFNFRISHLR